MKAARSMVINMRLPTESGKRSFYQTARRTKRNRSALVREALREHQDLGKIDSLDAGQ
jgi:predicted transcriptional regulator